MAKSRTVFVCTECGYESSKWMGKCPGCGSFATMAEETTAPAPAGSIVRGSGAKPVKLDGLEIESAKRERTGIEELDRVLGGGLVRGSAVLVGGDPGIGKSTLMLQTAAALSSEKVLYISGEESAEQIALRAERLGVDSKNIYVLNETEISAIAQQMENLKPACVIVDSIQTLYSAELTSLPGSVSQVRQSAGELIRLSKLHGFTIFIIGHVTKEGAIAGPRVLEHIVDTVLYFEGGRYDALRIVRAVKNRFGSTNEIGLFEMCQQGMKQVPYDSLLSGYDPATQGCALTATIEGSRAMLLELQALLCTTLFGNPRRVATGVDYNRMVLLMAVLEKKIGMRLGDQDAYLNVIGGIRIEERAADLAIAFAIASSFRNKAPGVRTALIGEVGLTGEVRPVTQIEKRVRECDKLGVERIILPSSALKGLSARATLCGVDTLQQTLEYLG